MGWGGAGTRTFVSSLSHSAWHTHTNEHWHGVGWGESHINDATERMMYVLSMRFVQTRGSSRVQKRPRRKNVRFVEKELLD